MQPERLHGKRRIDGHRQRHGNAMTSVRIVDRLQDTAGVQEPPRGEIFSAGVVECTQKLRPSGRRRVESSAAGLRCYEEAFAPCLGRQESVHDGVCASFRLAADLGRRPALVKIA